MFKMSPVANYQFPKKNGNTPNAQWSYFIIRIHWSIPASSTKRSEDLVPLIWISQSTCSTSQCPGIKRYDTASSSLFRAVPGVTRQQASICKQQQI